MEQKKIISWDISQGEPPANAHVLLDEYNSMIEEGIIKEHYIRKCMAKGSYETKVEFLIPMHNFEMLPKPHLYRLRYEFTGDVRFVSEDQERINICPKIVQLIAHSYMIKFINDRDDHTRDDNRTGELPA